MAAVHQSIAYKRELHAGDVVEIRSGMIDIGEKVIEDPDLLKERYRLGGGRLGRFEQLHSTCDGDCVHRAMPITDSEPSRSLIPTEADHGFRSKPITSGVDAGG